MRPDDRLESTVSLTSGRRLARNTVWNVIAQTAPLGVGVLVIPTLMHRMGLERFGVLTLIWGLVGYAGLLDLGIGRALTKLMADRLGSHARPAIAPLFWTALGLMLGVGIAAGVLLLLIVPWVVETLLHITPALQDEARAAFRTVALGIPVVTLAVGLRGVLEAHQRFRAIALINGILGAFTFLGPLLVLRFLAGHLAVMAGTVLLARTLATAFFFVSCLELDPDLARPRWLKADMQRLVGFGSWMTITNLVGPIMDNLDRFLLGALASVSVVAYYATPFDVITRTLLIPVALTGVLFPAFSAALRIDRPRVSTLFVSAARYVFLAVAPISLLLTTFAREGLALWLGASFAAESERIVQWLAAGVLLSALSKIPYALVQADGRPDLTALAHLVELPIYLVAAWLLIRAHGAEGAAVAWTLRILLDSAILFFLATRRLPGVGSQLARLGWLVVATFGTLYVIARAEPAPLRVLLGGISIVSFFFVAQRWVLNRGEIQQLRRHFTARSNPL